MCAVHTSCCCAGTIAFAVDRFEKTFQPFGRTGNRRRAEPGDAVLREPRSDSHHGMRTVEHIDALEAMHVDIDEPRDDGVTAKIDHGRCCMTGGAETIDALDDAVSDVQRAGGNNLIWQDDISAGEDDHAPTRAAARAAPITTASLPSVDRTMRNRSICSGCRRRAHSVLIESSRTSRDGTIVPPSTIASGSNSVTILATAIPRYFAVSRTIEIDTPSPVRLASMMSSVVILEKSPFTLSTTGE